MHSGEEGFAMQFFRVATSSDVVVHVEESHFNPRTEGIVVLPLYVPVQVELVGSTMHALITAKSALFMASPPRD